MVIKKALTVANVINQKVTLINFSEHANELYQAFGNPQNKGIWFVWGGSGSGKSSLVLDITKAFCKDLKAIHNELEEDLDDVDFINRLKLKNMQDVKDNFLTAHYNHDELCAYLDKRDSPKVVVINSATYFFKDLQQYHEFAKKYKRRKIIIITGMAKGNNPYSELETKIMYDANKKIFCSGYSAACKGRTIGPNGGTYIIWNEGYEKVNGKQSND
jgi:predicted ATP-dependent serine protease